MIKELEGDNGVNFRGYLYRNVTTGLLEHLLDPLSIAEGGSARKQGKSPYPYIYWFRYYYAQWRSNLLLRGRGWLKLPVSLRLRRDALAGTVDWYHGFSNGPRAKLTVLFWIT
jgi:hypothetical protein